MVQWEMESCVRGYYIYQSLWTPALNEELKEPLNSVDRYAVSVKKTMPFNIVIGRKVLIIPCP